MQEIGRLVRWKINLLVLDVPEVAAFNADGKFFFVRRAIVTFGLAIKYGF